MLPKVPDLVLGITGHRPDKLGVGALGIDQDACGVWARMGIAYVVAVPFPGQESRWPRESRERYQRVLSHAAGIYRASEVAPTSDKEAGEMLKRRNEWICCVCDDLIAVFDGSRGGTSHCLSTWGRICRFQTPIIIDPRELRLELESN